MARREYDQVCSVAGALDRVGERWSLLVVRELLLGPLRFSELARAVGGAPTDVLSKRLRELEEAGVVRRVRLDPPASATAYELTELGRGLERVVLELGRWGLNFLEPEQVASMPPASLPNALRVVLRPRHDLELTLALRTGERDYELRAREGRVTARRGRAESPDLEFEGTPWEVMTTLVAGEDTALVEGDPAALEALREMVDLPQSLRERALAAVAAT